MDLSELSVFLTASVSAISITDWICTYYQYFWLSVHPISISEWICLNYQYFWLYLSVLSVLLTGSVPTINISDCLSILSVFLNGSVSTISISDWICTYYQYFWLSVHPTKETKVGRKCWLNKYNDSRTCWSKSLRLKTTSDFENVAVRVCDHVDVANITFENSDHIHFFIWLWSYVMDWVPIMPNLHHILPLWNFDIWSQIWWPDLKPCHKNQYIIL